MPVGSIVFPVPVAPTSVTSKTEVKIVTATSPTLGATVEFWADIQGGAVGQVNTLTVTLGTTGDVYAVSISTGLAADPEIYSVVQETGDTATILAARLAKDLNNDSRVEAKNVAGVITVTGTTAGQAITISANPETLTTTPANLVLALVTAASGTSVYRKLASAVVVFTVNASGNPVTTVTPTFFDGSSNNVAIAGASAVERTHPKMLSTMRTENGLT